VGRVREAAASLRGEYAEWGEFTLSFPLALGQK
jgi:hypothetical protein